MGSNEIIRPAQRSIIYDLLYWKTIVMIEKTNYKTTILTDEHLIKL